jgi:hypothetical protein
MDTMEQMLSMLLGGAVETLDISPDLQQTAIARYEEVGAWLADNGGDGWRIYPQGSFRLGTVVRPATGSGEYDIDSVCRYAIAKENITQARLKQVVGDMLHGYLGWKTEQNAADAPKSCEPRRRCWTLTYPGFHLDVLPAIPDLDQPPNGIRLTDVHLREWQRSNPIGYAAWFRTRSEELARRLMEAAAKRHMHVADVPEWEVRTTLQRLVQVLKWHCMLRFTDDPDNKPPSILTTTLAAHAYDGEQDLFTAARAAVRRMPEFIENRKGIWWVPNPAHPEENFTDKWNEYPQRRTMFRSWLKEITTTLDDLAALQGKGVPAVAARLSESFTPEVIERSVKGYGQYLHEQRETGRLRMTSAGLLTTTAMAGPKVRGHTFHGD